MKVLKSFATVNLTLSILLVCTASSFGASAPLVATIDQILSSLGEAKVSIKIARLPDGRVLYEKEPNRLLNPASNVKIVTAAAALAKLGPDYTFKTAFLSERPIAEGRLQNLWVRGEGDPVFVTEELEAVVDTFKSLGLKEITGNLIVDDSWFDRDQLITYISDINEKAYSIVTGALSFNFNAPQRTRRYRGRRGAQTLRLPPGPYDPALTAGTALIDEFKKTGIAVHGRLLREAAPKNLFPIWTHTSPALREVLKGLGKFSNNFIAEQLVKTMAAKAQGPPGTTRGGLHVMEDTLDDLKIRRGTYRLENGSGLSKGNLFSASQIVSILENLSTSPSKYDFLSCLSVAGLDGTLKRKWRRSPLRGMVYAKTGSLAGVQALSGYLFKKGKGAVFSILFNDLQVSADQVTRVEQKILGAVVERL